MLMKRLSTLSCAVLTIRAQSTCQSTIAPQHAAPSVAPGFRVDVVANNLRTPRGILFDSEGGLLVVEQGHGISRLNLDGAGACVRATGNVQTVVDDTSVSAGIGQKDLAWRLHSSTRTVSNKFPAKPRHCSLRRRPHPLQFFE